MTKNLEQRLENFPLLRDDERLHTMAQAAVVIGRAFLNAPSRSVSTIPLSAEEKGVRLIDDFEFGAAVHGKQFQKDVKTNGTYYLVHGINGYANYAHGYEAWDVSVSWIRDNKIQAGVVYVPELGRIYYASLGEGAYFNGKRMKDPLPQRPLKDALIEVAPLFDRNSADPREARAVVAIRETIKELADQYHIVTRENQSGGKSLAELAMGVLDAYGSSWTSEGNLPAGVVIAKERGIVVTNIEEEEWQPGNLGVIAGNPKTYIHQVWWETLQKHYSKA